MTARGCLEEPIRLRAVFLALLVSLATQALPAARAGQAAEAPRASWGPIEQVEGAEARQVLVKGKPYAYFPVARRAPIRFKVRGPARLVVLSRVQAPPAAQGTFFYFLRVLGPHSPLRVQAFESGPDPDARLTGGGRATICESRRLVVSISAGEQEAWISVSGVPQLLVRLLREPPGGEKDGMTAIAPAEPGPPVVVKDGAERIPCYTVTRAKPLLFRVKGPTPFAVISRLDFAKAEPGPRSYTLTLSSGGKVLRTLQYNAVRSGTATYVGLPDRVPSRPDSVEIPLGSGPAEIRVELSDPPDGSVEVHARIAETFGPEEE